MGPVSTGAGPPEPGTAGDAGGAPLVLRSCLLTSFTAAVLPGLVTAGIAWWLPGPVRVALWSAAAIAAGIILLTTLPVHLVSRRAASIQTTLACLVAGMLLRLVMVVACGFLARLFVAGNAFIIGLGVCVVASVLLDAFHLALANRRLPGQDGTGPSSADHPEGDGVVRTTPDLPGSSRSRDEIPSSSLGS